MSVDVVVDAADVVIITVLVDVVVGGNCGGIVTGKQIGRAHV